jgi:cell division protein FtsB
VSSRAAATSPAATRGKHQRRPAAEAAEPARPKTQITPRAAVLVFSVFVVAMFAIAPIRGYLGQREQLAELERQATALERENAALQARIEDLNDPRTLERLARECLGMVDPGEIGFVTIPKGQAPSPPDCG